MKKILFLILILISSNHVSAHVYSKFYYGIGGVTVNDLKSNPRYPNDYNATSRLDTLSHYNTGNNYGQFVEGYIVPKKSGNYTFYFSADDTAEFYLSTDKAPENLSLIQQVTGWKPKDTFNTPSKEIFLAVGNKYYFNIFHKEAGGDDHFSVAWTGPGIEEKEIIGGENIEPVDNLKITKFTYNNQNSGNVINYGESCSTSNCKVVMPDAKHIKYSVSDQLLTSKISERRSLMTPYFRSGCKIEDAVLEDGSVKPECRMNGRLKKFLENTDEVGYFPGFVPDGVRKIKGTVTLDLKNAEHNVSSAGVRKMNYGPGNWVSTGIYLPAGEILKVSSKATKEELEGVHVATNIHTNSWRGKSTGGRGTVSVPISSGEVYFTNNTGGLVYLVNHSNKDLSIEIDIEGGVPAPWFERNHTKEDDWNNIIRNYPSPMAEISGELGISSVPSKLIRTQGGKETRWAAESYDLGVSALNELHGYNGDKNENMIPSKPWRFYHDVGANGGAHAGYPFVIDIDYPNRDWGLHTHNAVGGHGWRHEMCHNYQQRGWYTVQGSLERTVNVCANGIGKIMTRTSKDYEWGKNFTPGEWGRTAKDIEEINKKLDAGETVWYWDGNSNYRGGGGTYQMQFWHTFGDIFGWERYPEMVKFYREKYQAYPEIYNAKGVKLESGKTASISGNTSLVYAFFSESMGVDMLEHFNNFEFFKERISDDGKDVFVTNNISLDFAKNYIQNELKLPKLSEVLLDFRKTKTINGTELLKKIPESLKERVKISVPENTNFVSSQSLKTLCNKRIYDKKLEINYNGFNYSGGEIFTLCTSTYDIDLSNEVNVEISGIKKGYYSIKTASSNFEKISNLKNGSSCNIGNGEWNCVYKNGENVYIKAKKSFEIAFLDKKKDECPNGDLSGNYYDNKCERSSGGGGGGGGGSTTYISYGIPKATTKMIKTSKSSFGNVKLLVRKGTSTTEKIRYKRGAEFDLEGKKGAIEFMYSDKSTNKLNSKVFVFIDIKNINPEFLYITKAGSGEKPYKLKFKRLNGKEMIVFKADYGFKLKYSKRAEALSKNSMTKMAIPSYLESKYNTKYGDALSQFLASSTSNIMDEKVLKILSRTKNFSKSSKKVIPLIAYVNNTLIDYYLEKDFK